LPAVINFYMKPYLSYSLFFACLVLAACGDLPTQPIAYERAPQYAWGYQVFYGNYYNTYGIEENVSDLYLFTDSLKIDEDGYLTGYGQMLTLYDVTLPPEDTLLAAGVYHLDTLRTPFSFMPGQSFAENGEIFSSGSSIRYYELTAADNIEMLIVEGKFTVTIEEDTLYTLLFDLKTADGKELKGSLQRFALPAYDGR